MMFPIGSRVVHVKTQGRIRGVVKKVATDATGTDVDVLVDRLHGRVMTYDARNLMIEEDWDRQGSDGGAR